MKSGFSISFVRAGIVGLLLLFFSSCAPPDTVPDYYYILYPFLRQGGNRPTTPLNLAVQYQLIGPSINMQWQQSIDPELQIPVQYYYIYLYFNGPPAICCDLKDRLDRSVVPYYSITKSAADSIGLALPFTGTIYFQVTGWDLSAESLPSNTASLNLLSP